MQRIIRLLKLIHCEWRPEGAVSSVELIGIGGPVFASLLSKYISIALLIDYRM